MKRSRPPRVKCIRTIASTEPLPDIIVEDIGYDYLVLSYPGANYGNLPRYFPAAKAVGVNKAQYQLESSVMKRRAEEKRRDEEDEVIFERLAVALAKTTPTMRGERILIDKNQEEQYLDNIQDQSNEE